MPRPKGSFNNRLYGPSTTPQSVIEDIGNPGVLYVSDLTGVEPEAKLRRTALKYFARRWLGMTSDETNTGPLSAVVAAYNTRAHEFTAGVPAPAPVPMPERPDVTPYIPVPTSIPALAPIPATPTPAASPNPDILGALATLGQHMHAGVDAEQVRAIVAEALKDLPHNGAVTTIKIERPDVPTITLSAEPRHRVFGELLKALSAGLNVMLVGPAGCGKTHLCEQVAKALDRAFSFNGAVDSRFMLSGFIDAQGVYRDTLYRRSYEHGGVHLFDEIDGSSANALLYLNAGLANGQQDFPDTVVQRHENSLLVASANTFGNGADRLYIGRNQLDAASTDRFYVIEMDYDTELEVALYGAAEWVGFVHQVRAAVKTLALRHVVSMRAIDSGLKALAAGIDREAVEKAVLWRHLSAADIAKIKVAM
jgi:cobaltochelatase CobS